MSLLRVPSCVVFRITTCWSTVVRPTLACWVSGAFAASLWFAIGHPAIHLAIKGLQWWWWVLFPSFSLHYTTPSSLWLLVSKKTFLRKENDTRKKKKTTRGQGNIRDVQTCPTRPSTRTPTWPQLNIPISQFGPSWGSSWGRMFECLLFSYHFDLNSHLNFTSLLY